MFQSHQNNVPSILTMSRLVTSETPRPGDWSEHLNNGHFLWFTIQMFTLSTLPPTRLRHTQPSSASWVDVTHYGAKSETLSVSSRRLCNAQSSPHSALAWHRSCSVYCHQGAELCMATCLLIQTSSWARLVPCMSQLGAAPAAAKQSS